MNIRLMGAELFHVDGRTDKRIDMKKLILASSTIANAPNKETFLNT